MSPAEAVLTFGPTLSFFLSLRPSLSLSFSLFLSFSLTLSSCKEPPLLLLPLLLSPPPPLLLLLLLHSANMSGGQFKVRLLLLTAGVRSASCPLRGDGERSPKHSSGVSAVGRERDRVGKTEQKRRKGKGKKARHKGRRLSFASFASLLSALLCSPLPTEARSSAAGEGQRGGHERQCFRTLWKRKKKERVSFSSGFLPLLLSLSSPLPLYLSISLLNTTVRRGLCSRCTFCRSLTRVKEGMFCVSLSLAFFPISFSLSPPLSASIAR